MIDLIAAALLAATPTPAPAAGTPPANAHAQHHQAGQHQAGQHQGHNPGQPGAMAEMKDCWCKDKMAKMHQGHSAQPDPVR